MVRVDVREALGSLSHLRFDPAASMGRRDKEIVLIDPYLDDVRRILDSKAIRRIQDKTQVFSDPRNTHIRKRRSHTDEVVSSSLYVSAVLGLDDYLCQAVALGHDIGHAPFGHLGESVIARKSGTSFKHATFSVIVASEIERKGRGLNLTYEVLDAIQHHSCKKDADQVFAGKPQESKVIVYTDPISYTFADVGDMVRAGFRQESEFSSLLWEFGSDHRERTKTCLDAMILESAELGYISFEKSDVAQKFWEFVRSMYEDGYNKISRPQIRLSLELIYELFCELFPDVTPGLPVALLNDREANQIADLIEDYPRISIDDLSRLDLGLFEILPHLRGRSIPIDTVDLTWANQ